VVESPIGGIGVAVEADEVRRVTFGAPRAPGPEGPGPAGPGPAGPGPAGSASAVMAAAVRQLGEYFAGERTEFDLPMVGGVDGTEFDRAVWHAIAAIPYGETRSYGAIARAVGDPSAAQAVGTACNRNPLPIIVPCHRVIGADGKLVGFGGGLSRKRWLLQLEARVHIERTFAPD
jgi:methylated-DNA-[protein]-cysteine S-methyltransferase